MSDALRIVYAGTPEFAVPALERLVAAGHDVVAVYTQPDRPAGRGRRVRESPVKVTARRHGLAVHQPEGLRGADEQAALAGLAPDVMIVAAYGLILPRAVLAIPRHGCLNIHASLLPRWRGAAPIQRAILAGDRETGVCLMRMEAGLDTGPVIARRITPIRAEDTGGSVHDRLAALGATLMDEPLDDYVAGRVTPERQPVDGVTYAPKLDKAEARIDWSEDADAIVRRVRAFDPWPVAFVERPEGALRIWRAQALPAAARAEPGTVTAVGRGGIDVAAGSGSVRITELQPPGKRRQSAADFLNGRGVEAGERLGP